MNSNFDRSAVETAIMKKLVQLLWRMCVNINRRTRCKQTKNDWESFFLYFAVIQYLDGWTDNTIKKNYKRFLI